MRNRTVVVCLAGLGLLALASCVFIGNINPVADFTALPGSGTTPLDVSLDATASYDPDGTIVAYSWNFGDGQTASSSVFPFVHQFTVQSESATFTIVLTVVDNAGASGTGVQYVTVNP